jgi:hypothetical protein
MAKSGKLRRGLVRSDGTGHFDFDADHLAGLQEEVAGIFDPPVNVRHVKARAAFPRAILESRQSFPLSPLFAFTTISPPALPEALSTSKAPLASRNVP